MKTGQALVADVDECTVEHGACALWFMGQHGWIVKLGQTVLYLDPFLSAHPRRRIPPLLAPADMAHAHLIFASHDHTDHLDRPLWPAMAEAAPAARFVVADLLRGRLARELEIPLERLIGLDHGGVVTVGDLRLTGIAATHEFLDQDPETGAHPYLGYVIEGHGFTLYHSGDTCIYEGLQTALKQWRFDAVLLPINGRDAVRFSRGCAGNMTYQEAADLAGALEPGLTIPAHFDMFENNCADPALFVDYMTVKYPDLAVWVPVPAERRLVASV